MRFCYFIKAQKEKKRKQGELIIAQYTTADTDSYNYGVLMNAKCQPISDLPYPFDAYKSRLVFDYPLGNQIPCAFFTDLYIEIAQKYKEENQK